MYLFSDAATSPGAIDNIREIKEVGGPSKAQIMSRSSQQSLPVQEHQRREEWGNKRRRLIPSETNCINAQIKNMMLEIRYKSHCRRDHSIQLSKDISVRERK
ncbi:hypothetical protein IW262DRAFT_1300814 [Armillaria fumosa]|nr:hypothetical protein IW262DRAFT_1300814 [Armillaria fumosa]